MIGQAAPEGIDLGPFNLENLHGFPDDLYQAQRTRYANLEYWFDGRKFEEKQVQGGRTVDKYPIRLNPIRGAVFKHAYALFGVTEDDSRPLAPAAIKLADSKKDKATVTKGQEFLNRVWYASHGRSIMMRNAIISQIYGGCIYKVSYVPRQLYRRIPISVESVHPSNFVGVPFSGDEFRLEEAWVVRAISMDEAERKYGVSIKVSPGEPVYYIEYWNPEEYKVTINREPVWTGAYDTGGKKVYYDGENPYGIVPMVYTPHIRTTGFYGDSLISSNVQGIVEELNKRVADYGDAVSDDSHPYYYLTGSSGRPDLYELAPGLRIIQPPITPAITGKEAPAEIGSLGQTKSSAATKELTEELYDHFRREAFIPAVADGEDEGSQRSFLTLAMRMWPLLSHTAIERIYHGDALNLIDEYIFRIGNNWNPSEVPEVLLDARIERRWAPLLPRDSETFVNGLVSRAGAHLGSLEHLLSQLPDIEDAEEEVTQIYSEMEKLAKMQAAAQPKPQPQTPPKKKTIGGTSGRDTGKPSSN
jgi:hypothetical protein